MKRRGYKNISEQKESQVGPWTLEEAKELLEKSFLYSRGNSVYQEGFFKFLRVVYPDRYFPAYRPDSQYYKDLSTHIHSKLQEEANMGRHIHKSKKDVQTEIRYIFERSLPKHEVFVPFSQAVKGVGEDVVAKQGASELFEAARLGLDAIVTQDLRYYRESTSYEPRYVLYFVKNQSVSHKDSRDFLALIKLYVHKYGMETVLSREGCEAYANLRRLMKHYRNHEKNRRKRLK